MIMEEIAKLLAEYGVGMLIVCMFLWDWVTNRKSNTKALEEMSCANKNTAKSLEILEKNQIEQTKILIEINNRLEFEYRRKEEK